MSASGTSPDVRHPSRRLLSTDDQRRLRFVRAVTRIELDHHDTTARLEIAGDALEIRRAILDVMQHVVEERDVNVARRQRRIGELAEHRDDVRHVLGLRLASDLREESFVQLHRVHASGRHRLRERKREQPGSRAQVGHDVGRLQIQLRDHLAGSEARNALGALERLRPFRCRTRRQLRSRLVGENTRNDDCGRNDTDSMHHTVTSLRGGKVRSYFWRRRAGDWIPVDLEHTPSDSRHTSCRGTSASLKCGRIFSGFGVAMCDGLSRPRSAVVRVRSHRGEPSRAPVLITPRAAPVTARRQRLDDRGRRDDMAQRTTHRRHRARRQRHRRSSVARITSAIVGEGPSFHRLRNTIGGIRDTTPRIIQLAPDVAPSATKMARAHDDQSALNDH